MLILILVNITVFSPVCPYYSEASANLKTASPSQGFQIFKQRTASIHDWCFYKALFGYSLSIILNFGITSFHTANKTNTRKQKTGQCELKLPVISPGLLKAEFQSSIMTSFDKNQMKGFLHNFFQLGFC